MTAETHHPLQEELQFLLPLVARLPLFQLLLDDLQTHDVITYKEFDTVYNTTTCFRFFSHLFLPELDVINEFIRALKNLRFVFSWQVIESRISERLQHKNTHKQIIFKWLQQNEGLYRTLQVLHPLTGFLMGTTWRRNGAGFLAEISIGLKSQTRTVNNEQMLKGEAAAWADSVVHLFLFSRFVLLISCFFVLP